MKIDWSKHFDHIFCINLTTNTESHEKMEERLKRIGIDTKADYFTWHYAIDNKYYRILFNDKNICNPRMTNYRQTAFNTTMEHYSILRQSQDFGYNRILVIEDDEKFLKDINLIKATIEAMPIDYDLVMLDKAFVGSQEDYYECIKDYRVNTFFAEFKNNIQSGGCYSLTKKGIDQIIKIYDDFKFLPFDFTLNNNLNLYGEQNLVEIKKCMAIVNVSIQENGWDVFYFERTMLNENDYE